MITNSVEALPTFGGNAIPTLNADKNSNSSKPIRRG